jgi:hypothetical protein
MVIDETSDQEDKNERAEEEAIERRKRIGNMEKGV